MVVRKTNGSIRIFGNYSTSLIDALQPHQYPLPMSQDNFVKLANYRVFGGIIDMSESNLQLEVDEPSSKLLAINTGAFTRSIDWHPE